MRETPATYRARTGSAPPTSDLTRAGELLGTTPRPPADDEICPTLFRDVGPQALASFLDGTLRQLQGLNSLCVFLRDATLPGYSACVEQFGVLVFLRPLMLGPWLSGQPGIWIAENGRMPPRETLGFVPGGESLPALDAKLTDVGNVDALREVLGGSAYDDRVASAREELRRYLEDWAQVERGSAVLRAVLDGPSTELRRELLGAMAAEGLAEKDLRAPWFHLARHRREEARPLIAALAARFGASR